MSKHKHGRTTMVPPKPKAATAGLDGTDTPPQPEKMVPQDEAPRVGERQGLEIWQFHQTIDGCRNCNTEHIASKTLVRKNGEGLIYERRIVRYRRCRDCDQRYKHVTVLVRETFGWREGPKYFGRTEKDE